VTFLPELADRLTDVARRNRIPGAAIAVRQGDMLAEAATLHDGRAHARVDDPAPFSRPGGISVAQTSNCASLAGKIDLE